ncbi:MAG: SLOG family protein [Promethearchaeia archaeon]
MQEIERLCVTGSKNISDKQFVYDCLDRVYHKYKFKKIVVGDSKGVDEAAKQYADDHDLELESFKADWHVYGQKAGEIRNTQMVDILEVDDKGVAIWDGNSQDALDCINKLKKENKLLYVFRYDRKRKYEFAQ